MNTASSLVPLLRFAVAHVLSGLGHDGVGEKAEVFSESETALANGPGDLGAGLAFGDAKR